MSCNANAPCTTVWECRANNSKNRSSLGRKARNQPSIRHVHACEIVGPTAERHISVINYLRGKALRAVPGNPVIHRFSGSGNVPKIRPLQRAPEEMRDLADHAAAEGQHA